MNHYAPMEQVKTSKFETRSKKKSELSAINKLTPMSKLNKQNKEMSNL